MLKALRCGAGFDAGDIFIKQPLSLQGSAEEIFLRCDAVIGQIIEQIVCEEPAAIPQQGEPVISTRRTPYHSNLASCPEGDLSSWYDQIRMLDGEGYPQSFLEAHGTRLEFPRVSQRSDGFHADVKIMPIAASQPVSKNSAL